MTRPGRSERATFLFAKPQTPIIAVGLLQADVCMKWDVKIPARVGCRNAAEIETTRWPDPPARCRKGSQFPIRDIQCGSSFLLFSIKALDWIRKFREMNLGMAAVKTWSACPWPVEQPNRKSQEIEVRGTRTGSNWLCGKSNPCRNAGQTVDDHC
jgi:hypothetical protein